MSEDPRFPGGSEPAAPNTLGSAAPPNTLGGAPAPAPSPEPPADGTPGWTAGAPQRPKRTGRARLVGIVGIVAVVIVGLMIRFAVGTAVRGIADQLALAGTPMGRLSADERSAYSARLERALGDRAKGVSDGQVATLVEKAEADGLPHLDDTALVDHLAITTAAINAVDDPTCAAFGRAVLGSQQPADDISSKIAAAIPADKVKPWIEISVRAVEAGAASPAPVPTPDPAATQAAYTALLGALSAADLGRVQTITGNTAAASDADVCWTVRTIYQGAAALPLEQRVVIARVDVAP